MYLLVQAHQYEQYAGLLDQSFRLRKKIFADRLGWNVSVSGSRERDRYDDPQPAYFLWCDESRAQLYGFVRLIPGPTLLYDIFRETFPDTCDLVAPDNGINTMISNYEPYMKHIYQKVGAEFDELSRSHRFGRVPVCCGAFEFSKRVLVTMHHKIKVVAPFYRLPVFTQCITPEPSALGLTNTPFNPEETLSVCKLRSLIINAEFKHVAEALVPVPDAACVAEKLCIRCRDHCLSSEAVGADKLLAFDHARAILRPTKNQLTIRVEAQNLAMFYGIRMLLQASLSTIITISREGIEWQKQILFVSAQT